MRQCKICKIEKLESEFDQRKGKRIGYCKDCRREKIKQHYNNNVDYYIKKAKNHNKKYSLEFDNYKKTLFCTDCNLSFKNEPYLCDFHHIEDDKKDYNVGQMRYFSMKKIMKEIEKCIPLCPICHRRRHALLAKMDKAPEYESGDFESSNLSQGT